MKKIYLFAAVFALLAGISTFFFANSLKNSSAVKGEEEANVVIALRDIEPDMVATPDMFEVVKLPVNAITYGTLVSVNDIDGYVVAEKISKGEQVLASKLIRIGEKTNLREKSGEYRLSYHISNGSYAYSIKVDDADSVAYFIRKGDYINIFYKDEEGPVLRNVKVLEIGSYSDHKLLLESSETADYTLITVSLSEEEIGEIMKYDDSGSGDNSFHIALVPYTEGAQIDVEADSSSDNSEEYDTPETNYAMGEIISDVDVSDGND